MGVPFWVFLSSKYDKHRVWCCAMIYACFIFMVVLFLEEGDLTLFVVICIFSGLALSADLAIPSSIQADIIDLEFLKTTMLSSDKGDPEMRIKGLRHLIFKPETLTRL